MIKSYGIRESAMLDESACSLETTVMYLSLFFTYKLMFQRTD